MLLNRLGEKETLAISLHSGYGCVVCDAPTVYAYGYGYGHGSGSGFGPCGGAGNDISGVLGGGYGGGDTYIIYVDEVMEVG